MATITHKMTLSTTDFNLVGNIKVRQADDKTQVFEVNGILENGIPKSFLGMTPFFCLMPREVTGQGVTEERIEEFNASSGTLKYTLSGNAMQMVGRNEAYFSFRKETSGGRWIEQFSTKSFYYTVEKSIYTQPFKDSNYWFTFTELYRKFMNYQENSKVTWEEFVESSREIMEGIEPGGQMVVELSDARYSQFFEEHFGSLKKRLDFVESHEYTEDAGELALDQYLIIDKLPEDYLFEPIKTIDVSLSYMPVIYVDLSTDGSTRYWLKEGA